MALKVQQGVAAYGRAAAVSGAAPGGAGDGAEPAAAAGPDFASLVSGLVTDAGATLREAEKASARQVAGKGDLIDVVTAIGAAETALNTVVAVRDRVVGAYNEIMRMQI
ncbi:flagellar hook-basal body complex protein FliE [Sphingomonas morindae]|uniref:Flagellar hook-basal body complex protein FliE n=1 Tax=Sphingomonas morindae TaxID=1541170 RepID=A0ABY4X532_9SPHN|nr:flagellar hook-basal body complex protein FliE [Sphingomonas morindae]USI72003.1 flagellar hook-basal body complex protein FliE [Sphingomonas morindae]